MRVLHIFLLIFTTSALSEDAQQSCDSGFTKGEMKLSFCVYDPPGDTEQNLPPVILLHGMIDSKATWYKLGPLIAKETGRKVYAFDARNHGESFWSDDFNFDILADDLDNFMDDQGIRKAVLVGHSMGGKTALTLALRKPERVEKLIVEDMTTRNFSSRASNVMSLMVPVLREAAMQVPKGADEMTAIKTISDFVMKLLPKGMLPPGNEQLLFSRNAFPIRKQEDGSYAWKTNLDVLERVLSGKDNLKQDLAGVYMGDSLFLYGPKSQFRVYRDEALIKKYFPRAQLVAVENADHLIHHKHPKEFLNNVVTFINGFPSNQSRLQSKY